MGTVFDHKICFMEWYAFSIVNILHGSGRAVDKGIMLQIENAPEANGGDLTCHVFSFGDAVAGLNVIDPKNNFTIET